MLGTPIEDVLSRLPLPDEIKSGYVDPNSRYHTYLQLLAALEQSVPEDIQRHCKKLNIEEENLADVTLRAMVWANQMNQLHSQA